jgi:hypothetical protein
MRRQYPLQQATASDLVHGHLLVGFVKSSIPKSGIAASL